MEEWHRSVGVRAALCDNSLTGAALGTPGGLARKPLCRRRGAFRLLLVVSWRRPSLELQLLLEGGLLVLVEVAGQRGERRRTLGTADRRALHKPRRLRCPVPASKLRPEISVQE